VSRLFLFFLSVIRKERRKDIMLKTIRIYRRFFARQPQLNVLNSNRRVFTRLLIEPEGHKHKQSIFSSLELNEFPVSVMRLKNFLLY
jgi:hypothetical protein